MFLIYIYTKKPISFYKCEVKVNILCKIVMIIMDSVKYNIEPYKEARAIRVSMHVYDLLQ